jgi:hypothetical protein
MPFEAAIFPGNKRNQPATNIMVAETGGREESINEAREVF